MIRCLSVLAIVALSVLRGGAYEIHPAPGSNAVSLVQLVPAPLGTQALMYGGQRLALFTGDGSNKSILWWVPRNEFRLSHSGGKAHVQAKNWAKAGPAEFIFDGSGQLAAFRRDADDAQRAKDLAVIVPKGRLTLKHWWPKPKPPGDFWRGIKRLRLGYQNPNAAGTLFAELSILALAGLVFLPRLWMRVASGAGLAAFLAALFLTESRGSFIGFCLGAFLLALISTLRCFSVKKMVLWGGVVALAAGLLAFGAFGDRFGKNLLERNAPNRLRLQCWQAAPAMMAAAPGGWGEKCGHAYCDWFQPETVYLPRTWLFNSHLTWMVEHGWWFRFFYCSGWFLLLIMLGVSARRSRAVAGALAMWLTFAVAIWFSTIGQCWTLWILPVCALLALVPGTFKDIASHAQSFAKASALAVVLGASVCVILWVHGGRALGKMPVKVHYNDGVTTVGDGRPDIWILRDDNVLSMGLIGAFGREMRDFLRRHPGFGSMAITKAADKIPAEVGTLVASGDVAREYMKVKLERLKAKVPEKVKRMVIVSPSFQTRFVPPSLVKRSNLLFLSGELVKYLYLRPEDATPSWAGFVPGAGMYVPRWMDIVFKEKK